MKVKIPKEIKIGAFSYSIKMVEGLENDYHLLGQCLTDKGIIKLEMHSIPQVKDATLLHEVVHAINDVFVCKIDDECVERIAQGLAEILKNNLGIEFDWSEIKNGG